MSRSGAARMAENGLLSYLPEVKVIEYVSKAMKETAEVNIQEPIPVAKLNT
jgi:hypothetical protein